MSKEILFYPTLTRKLSKEAGITLSDILFSYTDGPGGTEEHLLDRDTLRGGKEIELKDRRKVWDVETRGVTINRTISIADTSVLKGPRGIVCSDAEIYPCCFWTCDTLTEKGCILPERSGNDFIFNHTFAPGELKNSLGLRFALYLARKAENVADGEKHLMNDPGVTLGELETTVVNFDETRLKFPIKTRKDKNMPLWWIDISAWEDPCTLNRFDDRESFCVYLNPYYASCPGIPEKAGEPVKNPGVLVDILATVYLILFQKLSGEDLKATIENVELTPGSICSVLHEFINSCPEGLACIGSPRENAGRLHRSLQQNIRKIFEGNLQ